MTSDTEGIVLSGAFAGRLMFKISLFPKRSLLLEFAFVIVACLCFEYGPKLG